MGNVVNLNRFRKRVEREASAKQADANRSRFGRTKAERSAEEKRTSRAQEILDQHRIDHEELPLSRPSLSDRSSSLATRPASAWKRLSGTA